MTPDRRLDQLEPLMADSLQKTDRLIEGQGQLMEIATRADQKADTTAKGVVNLTLRVNQIAEEQADFRSEVRQEIANFRNEVREDGVNFRSEVRQDITDFRSEVSQEVANFRDEVRQDIASLRAGQELILQILREKLR